MINTVILTGRPGSGKGTQGKRIAAARGWTHFSTGEQFRVMREEDSILGARVKEIYDRGGLLPDWFATYLFEKAILNIGQEAGIVCEGYPRSVQQAHMFEEIAVWINRPYVVIDLEVSDEIVTERMLKRAEVENRPDSSTVEQIQGRLATYNEHTKPVLDFFRAQNKLVVIDGAAPTDEVTAAIEHILG